MVIPSVAAAGFEVAVMHGKPLGVPLTIDVASVALVNEMAKLVDQDVVQIEVLCGFFAPSERPRARLWFVPSAAVHACFIDQVRPRRAVVLLDERFFDRVQVQCVAPLHAVAGERLLLAGHLAELYDFELLQKLFGYTR